MKVSGSIVHLSKFFMLSIGLWKIPFTPPKLYYCYIIYSAIIQSIIYLFTASMSVKTLLIALAIEETDNVFNSISVAAIYLDMALKIIIYINTGLPEMFKEVLEEEKLVMESSNRQILNYYKKQSRIFFYISIYQTINSILSVSFYIGSNLLLFPISSKEFMYDLWIPFPINWKVVVTFEIGICLFAVFVNTANHISIQSIIIFVSIHLRILQINIVELFETGNTVEIAIKVKKLVQKHQYLIGFVKNLNNSVRSIILLEFVLDSVNLAAGLLQIITAQSIVEVIFSVIYLVLLISQLFILAWTTNEINIQSLNVSNAVYESNWIDQTESIKKTMLIMIMRSQKPLSLTIGPFRPMNLEAGIMTLKGAYSYAGVMRQTYS